MDGETESCPNSEMKRIIPVVKFDKSAYLKPERNSSAPATACCRSCNKMFSSDDILRNEITRLSAALNQDHDHDARSPLVLENAMCA